MREIHHPEAAAPSSQRAGGLRLTTARLVLRDWTPADLPDLIEGLNDLRVSCWLAFVPHPYTSADAERWLTYCTQLREKEPHREQYEFAIELSSAQKVIGGVSLTRVSRLHGTAGGGIWINTRYQGQGYGSEAFGEKIRFAFEDLQLRRLENGFFTGNTASFALQQRFGYQLEGERRQAYRCMADGTLKNECITGLLKAEWKKG
jgi:ribosomal-protein-alanine N-acetyltransferase